MAIDELEPPRFRDENYTKRHVILSQTSIIYPKCGSTDNSLLRNASSHKNLNQVKDRRLIA